MFLSVLLMLLRQSQFVRHRRLVLWSHLVAISVMVSSSSRHTQQAGVGGVGLACGGDSLAVSVPSAPPHQHTSRHRHCIAVITPCMLPTTSAGTAVVHPYLLLPLVSLP